jgi:uncharacterized protein (DUF1501 family)
MRLTRRDLIRSGIGATTLLASGRSVPTFLARAASALAASPRADKGRVLVVLQFDGGNDGLNTVVPYRDDDYRKHRPTLQLAAGRLHKIDDRVGLHSSLGGLAKLLERQQLAVVQSVGYPNPNRSHFESMAIWHTARLKADRGTPGWLARGLNERPAPMGGDARAMHIGETMLPQALVGSQGYVPSLASLEQFRRRLGMPEGADAGEQRTRLDSLVNSRPGAPGSLLQFVQRSTLLTYNSSARLEGILRRQKAPAGYPDSYGLAGRLKLIAQLIKAGLTTAIYYTQLDGFDTHANQLVTHANLLREAGDSLKAFFDDLREAGADQRVLVLVFSEFGRRLAENASAGTDHGTAAPVLLLGGSVHAGVHGPHPNLHDLQDGDPEHAIDFRQIYATVLDHWLACPSEKVLGEKFEHLPLLRSSRLTS